MALDIEELVGLVELLKQLDFTDFHFQKGDLSIAVRRGGLLTEDPIAPRNAAAAPLIEVTAKGATSPTLASTKADAPLPGASFQVSGDHIVTAPLLGTIYHSPKPGESPFVTVGARVNAEDTLCVIEVMKLYNSVTAGISGVVSAVLANAGQLVEFGQPLFAIRIDT